MGKKRNKTKKQSNAQVLYKAYIVVLSDESCHVLMGTEKQIQALQEPYVNERAYSFMQLIGCNKNITRLRDFVSSWTQDANNPIIDRRLVTTKDATKKTVA
jgi:hypothetical protein